MKKRIVKLTDDQKGFLNTYISTGVRDVRSVRRARTLLMADQGILQKEIAIQLRCTRPTVCETIKRFFECDCDVKQALLEKPRSGQPTKITPEIEAHITVMACSEGPDGRSRWNLRLMAKNLVKLELVESISPETVRQVLKKVTSNPGSASTGASAK